MLKIFASSFNQNIKFSLLQLIEEIILMLSGETLKAYLQPHLFSRFVISTMKTDNYTWIEICLRIMLLLTEKKVTTVNLSLHREGIRDYLSVLGDKGKFKDLTGIEVKNEEEEEKKAPVAKKSKKETLMDFFVKSKNTPSKVEELMSEDKIELEKVIEIKPVTEVDEKPEEEVKEPKISEEVVK